MKKTTFPVYLCCTLFSCSNVEKKAGERLQTTRAAFGRGDYNGAKMQIDSIKILCPETFETGREGIGLVWRVELEKQEKIPAYLNGMLREKQEAVDVIKGNYAFEKDAEYQRIGNYLYPSQVIEKNLHRSYLRFQVDENDVMSMTSIYRGPYNIHHLTVKVAAPGGSFAETPASEDSYETTDLGERIERTDYKVGEGGSVIAFLDLSKDRNIHVNYLGEHSYTTAMTPDDHKAVAAAYELAQLLSAIIEIKKNKDEASLKIELVKRKMAERGGREKE